MRRILTKSQQKSKERFNQILVGLVLIFIMMLSIIGYSLIGREKERQEEKVIYRGVEFINRNGVWVVEQEGIQFVFKYNPEEVEKIDSPVNYINSYYNEPLYINSEDIGASNEIYSNMNQLVQRMQSACLSEENCEEDWPVKECDSNFIIIRERNITGITQNESCVFIEGPRESLVRLTDEFLFKILGIE